MSRIIKILPGEGENPEFAPDRKDQEGIECAGFLLLTFDKDLDLQTLHMDGISAKNLADAIGFHKDDSIISIMRQASAMAEGYIRAAEIWRQQKKEDKIGKLLRIFEGDDGEEDD